MAGRRTSMRTGTRLGKAPKIMGLLGKDLNVSPSSRKGA